MQKHRYLLLLVMCLGSVDSLAQTDCKKEFSADDIYRWKSELKFIPRYAEPDLLDYLILKSSERAYRQMYIEIVVRCDKPQDKENQVTAMWYFWDKKIPTDTIEKYFPAYYVFYQLDKSAMGSKN